MIKRILIVTIAILLPFVGRGLFFYNGFYSAPPSEIPGYDNIVVPLAPSTDYSDAHKQGEGTVLVDLAHDNDFDLEELNVLISHLVSRGLTVDFFSPEDDLKKELLGNEEEEEQDEKEGDTNEEFQAADAYIIVCPLVGFSKEERETVVEFVDNGGKLLLIGDPTRSSQINSISIIFGLIFEADYLYNQKENDANYRNIFVAEFKENAITKDLTRIALYTAGSITSSDDGIAFVDENTFSSVLVTRPELSPIAQAREFGVLAIYDLTFMTEPYSGIADNMRLISNVADWLATTVEEEEEEEEEQEEQEEEAAD